MAMFHKWDTRWTIFIASQHEPEQAHWRWFISELYCSSMADNAYHPMDSSRETRFEPSSRERWERHEPLDQRDWNEVFNDWERIRTAQQDVSWRTAIPRFRDVDKDDEIQPDKVLIIRLSEEGFAHYGISLPARESDDERNTNVPRKARDFLVLVVADEMMLVGLPGMQLYGYTKDMQKEIEDAEERERRYDERDRQRAAARQEGLR
ncbi:hypothetical protein BGX38DRAFT_1220356 [Terfezia claveryi]|nr:hypothetical protein BGX38DRAFT_1220356 [Terfezia claveryi]